MASIDVRKGHLEYEVWGGGNIALLLIPGGVVADAFKPLASELARAQPHDFRIVIPHRRGYGGSSRPPSPFTMQDQAEDCLALMDGLGLETAHVVGHSLSGLIALQLAQAASGRVSSLVLIEPSLVGFVPGAAQAAQALGKVGALYQSGDRVGAVDMFMRGVSGEQYRNPLDTALPDGWFQQAAKDLDTFFQIELPAIRSWNFDVRDRVTMPILSIYGTEKRWGGVADTGAEFNQVVRSWFPQTESLPMTGAYHWPHITNPAEVAREVTRFVRRHAAKV